MQVAVAKNPKKKVIWPWVLLGSFLLTIVAPIALAYGFFYDSNTKKVDVDPSFNFADMGKQIMVDSLDTAESEEMLKINITDGDMDNILHKALSDAKLLNRYLTKGYVVVKGNKYYFYVDLDGVVIKSRAKLTTTLTEENDAFYFQINDVALGRLGGLLSSGRKLIDRYVNEQTVGAIFQQAGLSITFDKENYRLIYKKSDVIQDLKKLTSDASIGMYFDIVQTLMDRGVAQFDFTTTNFLDVDINLKELQTNELVTDDADHKKIDSALVTTGCKDKLLTLVSNNAIEKNDNELGVTFTYLFSGYDALSDAQKQVLEGKNFSSIGITDIPSYDGLVEINKDPDFLKHQMEGKIMTFAELLHGAKKISLLSESDLNTYIQGRNILGFTTLLHRSTNDGYKVNYITVDNFYSNLYENAETEEQLAEFVCKINVNGYSTSLTFETNVEREGVADNSLTFKVKDDGIRYGNISAQSLNDTFFSVMAGALNSADETVVADTEAHTITIKLGTMVNTAKNALLGEFDKQINPLPEMGVLIATGLSKEELKTEFTNYVNNIFKNENAEVIVEGANRGVDGNLTLNLKENNPPESIKKIVTLISGS